MSTNQKVSRLVPDSSSQHRGNPGRDAQPTDASIGVHGWSIFGYVYGWTVAFIKKLRIDE